MSLSIVDASFAISQKNLQRLSNPRENSFNLDINKLVGQCIRNHQGYSIRFESLKGRVVCNYEGDSSSGKKVALLISKDFIIGDTVSPYQITFHPKENTFVLDDYGLMGGMHSNKVERDDFYFNTLTDNQLKNGFLEACGFINTVEVSEDRNYTFNQDFSHKQPYSVRKLTITPAKKTFYHIADCKKLTSFFSKLFDDASDKLEVVERDSFTNYLIGRDSYIDHNFLKRQLDLYKDYLYVEVVISDDLSLVQAKHSTSCFANCAIS